MMTVKLMIIMIAKITAGDEDDNDKDVDDNDEDDQQDDNYKDDSDDDNDKVYSDDDYQDYIRGTFQAQVKHLQPPSWPLSMLCGPDDDEDDGDGDDDHHHDGDDDHHHHGNDNEDDDHRFFDLRSVGQSSHPVSPAKHHLWG